MAMDKATLGKALADLVMSPTAPADMQAKILKTWTDIADIIITHIQENATVTVPAGIAVTVAPTTGTGATTAPATGTIA